MAVQACMNPKHIAEDTDDDEPLVFTRRKPNQINSELKNSSSSVKPDRQPGKSGSDVRTLNDRSSSVLKGKTISSSKPSSSKPALGTIKSPPPPSRPQKSPPPLSGTQKSPPAPSRPQKSPPSSNRPSPSPPQSRAPPVKSPSLNGASSANHQPKRDIPVKEEKRAPIAVKEEKPVKVENDESDDSDDNKPLSARCSAGSQKGNCNVADVEVKPSNRDLVDSDDEKPLSARMDKGRDTAGASQTQKLKGVNVKSAKDSDDEKPLSSKYQMKSTSGTSSSKYDDSDEDKPLARKIVQQNGSIKRDTQIGKLPLSSGKRPSAEASAGQSSTKKAKFSDVSTSDKAKQMPVKARAKDDDDHVPIGQRINKAASASKSTPMKKVTRVDSSKLKKVNKKSKKIMKKSKFSKSSKELPNSGDGQKWTTLVHSGVIFPPPYQPHRVKMLYNGKPVDLTPEQEEVRFIFPICFWFSDFGMCFCESSISLSPSFYFTPSYVRAQCFS